MNVKVLGHTYRVRFSNKEYHNSGNTGTIQYFDQVINIDNNSHIEYQEETLVHELFEAVRDCFDMREKMDHPMLSQLSEAWYAIIKDNPHIFRMKIQEGEE